MEIPVQPVSGLWTDGEPINQPKNTYRSALNMCNDIFDGGENSMINENGELQCYSFDAAFTRVVGQIALNDGAHLLLLRSSITGRSKVGIFKDCNFIELIDSGCLNFDFGYPVKGLFKIVNGCDRIVTLYDGFNSDKYINLDKLELYYTPDYATYLAANPGTTPYDYWDITGEEAFDCNKMKLDPNFTYPTINYEETLNYGGALEVGLYQVSLELLDSAKSRLGFTMISPQVPITNESTNAEYYSYDGAYNLSSNWTEDQGAVPFTNKSIRYQFTGINDPVRYVRVCIIKTTTGDGVTQRAYLKPYYIEITAGVIDWLFTGINSSTDVDISLDEITSVVGKYETSKAQEIIDTRLVRANLKEETINWAVFQKEASKILTNYTEKELDQRDNQINNKSGQFYFYNKSNMRDEIECYAISYVLDNGVISPPFHIPGRPANMAALVDTTTSECVITDLDNAYLIAAGNTNDHQRNQVPGGSNWDTQLLDVVTTITDATTQVLLEDVTFLGFTTITDDATNDGAGKVARWRVFNTFVHINSEDSQGAVLGYHQLDNEDYPVIPTCDELDYWGEDYWGNELVGTPVRHHRMPDSNVETFPYNVDVTDPDQVITTVKSLGIKFSNIVAPRDYEDRITGFIIQKIAYEESNRSVFDKGYILYYDEIDVANPSSTHTEYYGELISPRINLLKEFNGTYLKYEATCPKHEVLTPYSSGSVDGSLHKTLQPNNPVEANTFVNRTLDEYKFVTAKNKEIYDEYILFKINNYLFTNKVFSHDPLVFQTDNIITGNADHMYYVSIKKIPVIPTLDQIIYRNVSQVINIQNCNVNTYNGDYFIPDLTTLHKVVEASQYTVQGFYSICESFVNAEFRHDPLDTLTGYYLREQDFEDIRQLLFNKQYDLDSLPGIFARAEMIPESKLYNVDFHTFYHNNLFKPLSTQYDFCSECLNEYPNRIIWSPKSFEEQTTDSWKTNLANDYIDIDASKGEINDLYFNKNQLYVKTDRSLWNMTPNPQQINTDVSNVYIGSGDFLSLPPIQYVKKDFGFGGTISKLSGVSTEFGHTYVDAINGKVFHIDSSISEISSAGMSKWFMNNLPFKLEQQIRSLGINFHNTDSTLNYENIGIIASYDPVYKRYILHKQDYELRPENTLLVKPDTTPSNSTTNVYYDGAEFSIYNAGAYTVLSLTDTDYFMNRSWTMTYSYTRKMWLSWHSYQPNFMFFDNLHTYKYYTGLRGSHDIYMNSNTIFQTYGNEFFPAFIDFPVVTFPHTTDFNAFHWFGNTEVWDSTTRTWRDVNYNSFDEAIFYTKSQSTGSVNLRIKDYATNPFDNIQYDPDTKIVYRKNKDYKLSQIRDISTDDPVISYRWEDIGSYFDSSSKQGWIDHVPYDTNLDYNKSVFQLNSIKDKYMNCRLFLTNYNSEGDIKISINLLQTNNLNSIR